MKPLARIGRKERMQDTEEELRGREKSVKITDLEV
jgi:hypothetical protein